MAFTPKSPGTGVEHSEIVEVIMGSSLTFQVGEACSSDTTTGFLAHAAAGAGILGIIVGFVNSNDSVIPPTAYSPGTATQTNVTSVTTSSSNTTVAKQKALVETSTKKKYSAQVNGTVGTTVHSDQMGARVDVDSAGSNYGRVLETTATRTASTVANFYDWGTDPDDSTRLIVSIAASELFTKIG